MNPTLLDTLRRSRSLSAPVYRNWSVPMSEGGTPTAGYVVLDAAIDGPTPGYDARGFWLDADHEGESRLADLSFSTTSDVAGLSWTVLRSAGLGRWSYAGETVNADGTSTYTFTYAGPTAMPLHVPGHPGAEVEVRPEASTGFVAQSSTFDRTQRRTWVNRTSSGLWGNAPYAEVQTQEL